MSELKPRLYNLPFLLLIRFYQKVISPTIPARCRFYPSCSQYARESFEKYNPIKAFFLSSKRLLRCHPWGGSGFDPVP